jgi:hypothetical protein
VNTAQNAAMKWIKLKVSRPEEITGILWYWWKQTSTTWKCPRVWAGCDGIWPASPMEKTVQNTLSGIWSACLCVFVTFLFPVPFLLCLVYSVYLLKFSFEFHIGIF